MYKRILIPEYLQFITVIIVIVCVVPGVSTENVTITSTISDKHLVCPGDQVNFTCVTRGSDIIAWISKEYIDRGGTRVEFAAFNEGETMRFGQSTVVTLVNADIVNGIRVLISRLTITVSSDYLNPSVTCLHVGLLINATVFFMVPAIPGVVLETIAFELLGASGTGCVIFTQWESPNNTNESNINYYIIHVGNKGISNTSYIANENSKVIHLSRCMVQFVFIRALDKCNREGVLTSVPIQLFSVRDTETFTSADVTVTSVTSGSPTSRNVQSGAGATTIASISIVLTMLLTVALSIIVLIICLWAMARSKGLRKEQHTVSRQRLEADSGEKQQEMEMHTASSIIAKETATKIEDIGAPVSSQSDVAINRIQKIENELAKVKNDVAKGQNKLSVVEEKLISLKERELEDVRQEHEKLQGALEDQKENKEALMKEILEKMQGESQDQKQQLSKVEQEQKQMKEILGELSSTLMQLKDTQEQEASKSVTSTELKDQLKDEGMEQGASLAETAKTVESSETSEKSGIIETPETSETLAQVLDD